MSTNSNMFTDKVSEDPIYLDDPHISPAAYVNPSAPWVAGRAYSTVPREHLRPTLFRRSAFNGNKFHFYCVIRGARTGILIDGQQVSSYVQGYPNFYMVKVKSQAEALRLYNTSWNVGDVQVVRQTPHFVRSLKNPWAIICILMLITFVVVFYRM